MRSPSIAFTLVVFGQIPVNDVLIGRITPFLENEDDAKCLRSGDYEIKSLDYNWDLNTLANAL